MIVKANRKGRETTTHIIGPIISEFGI